MGAFAEVRIGRGKPFRVSSGIATLLGVGRTTVLIGFGRKHLRKMRSALHHHHGVSIKVFGRLYGNGSHVVKHTGSKTIHIHG